MPTHAAEEHVSQVYTFISSHPHTTLREISQALSLHKETVTTCVKQLRLCDRVQVEVKKNKYYLSVKETNAATK